MSIPATVGHEALPQVKSVRYTAVPMDRYLKLKEHTSKVGLKMRTH